MSGEVFHFHIDESVSSEFGIVATEYMLVFSCRGQNAVSVEGFERVEIEYEKQIVAQECEYLVSVVFTEFNDRGSFKFLRRESWLRRKLRGIDISNHFDLRGPIADERIYRTSRFLDVENRSIRGGRIHFP